MKLYVPNNAGARIAILGSGPSLNQALEHSDAYDIGIAINSAVKKEGLRFDYFQSNHAFAHSAERGWQAQLSQHPDVTILMNSSSAPYWQSLFPDQTTRLQLQEEHRAFLKDDPRTHPLADGAFDDGKLVNNYFRISRNSSAPHIVYNKIPIDSLDGDLLDHDENVIDGASSAGAAIHMATLMGAKEIVLFGVQMTNQTGGNYALPVSEAEQGKSTPNQKRNLERLFQELHERGIPTTIYGPHAFESAVLREK